MIAWLNEIGITDHMITSTVLSAVIIACAVSARRGMKMIPEGFLPTAAEIAVEKLYNFFSGAMGEAACKKYFPVVATLFIYILFCNYSGILPFAGTLPGFEAPTNTINFPAGMAILVFLMTQYIGLRESGGIRYYRFLFKPFVFLFPFLLLDEIVRPVSLTFRLYGNVFGEETIVEAFYDLIPVGLPIIMMAFALLMSLIQAMVFSLLAAIYFASAYDESHPEEGELQKELEEKKKKQQARIEKRQRREAQKSLKTMA